MHFRIEVLRFYFDIRRDGRKVHSEQDGHGNMDNIYV